MAFLVADRVREFSTTSSTSDFLLGGAAVGYQTFLAGIGSGNSTYYAASLPGTTQWEVGIGTVSVGTLTRDVVLASSTGGKVPFSVGTKDIFCTSPADRSLYVFNGQIVAQEAAVLAVANGGTGVTSLGALITALNVPVLDANNAFTGANSFSGVDINGGTIDGTAVGGTAPAAGSFTTLTSNSTTTLNGTTIPASKTLVDTDSSQTLTNKALNGTVGATTPASGSFTTLTSNSTTTLNGTTIPASKTLVDTDSSQTLTNKALNGTVGATTPASGTFTALKATSTVEVPVWTTATRPATGGGEANFLGFNSDTAEFEGWNGAEWASVGGSKITVDNTTALNLNPVFVDSTSGTAKEINVDDTLLNYNPAQGVFSAGLFMIPTSLQRSVTVPAGHAVITTNFSVPDGLTLTVEDGGLWTDV